MENDCIIDLQEGPCMPAILTHGNESFDIFDLHIRSVADRYAPRR